MPGTAPVGTRTAEPRTLTTREAMGFRFLGANDREDVEPEAGIAEDASAFTRLLEVLHFRGSREVDFSRFVAFYFSTPNEGCLDPAEPAALTVTASGVLEPALLSVDAPCLANGPSRRRVRLVAIARWGLPSWGFRFRLMNGTSREFQLRHPLGRLPVPDPPDEPSVLPLSGRVRGNLSLPLRGGAEIGRLDDGTFVWVTRHADGSVSALDARLTYDVYRLLGLPGLRNLISWQPRTRRFSSVYDEYGVGIGKVPNLPRYEAEIDETRSLVRVGEKQPALSRKLMEPVGDNSAIAPATSRPPFSIVALERALRMADDTIALIDASLVLSPDRPPRVCPGSRWPAAMCSRLAVEPVGLESVRLPRNESMNGPLVVRIHSGRVHDVMLTESDRPHSR